MSIIVRAIVCVGVDDGVKRGKLEGGGGGDGRTEHTPLKQPPQPCRLKLDPTTTLSEVKKEILDKFNLGESVSVEKVYVSKSDLRNQVHKGLHDDLGSSRSTLKGLKIKSGTIVYAQLPAGTVLKAATPKSSSVVAPPPLPCSTCGKVHPKMKSFFSRGLADLKEELERCRLVDVTVSMADGKRTSKRVCEDMNVGELRTTLAGLLRVDLKTMGLRNKEVSKGHQGRSSHDPFKFPKVNIRERPPGPALDRIATLEAFKLEPPASEPGGDEKPEPGAVESKGGEADDAPPMKPATGGSDRTKIVTWKDIQKRWDKDVPEIKAQRSAVILGVRMPRNCSFFNQTLAPRRMGWLFGKKTDEGWLDIHAVYEPPQRGFRERILMLPDNDRGKVDTIVKMLGLKLVGWVFSCDESRSSPLVPEEVLRAAQLQREHGDHFVTVTAVTSGGSLREAHAWQMSQQCVAFTADGALVPGEKPGTMTSSRRVRAPTAEAGGVVETNEIDIVLLLTVCAIKDHEDYIVSSHFPVKNRYLSSGEHKVHDTKTLYQYLLNRLAARDWKDVVSDFHLLVFLATNRYKRFEMSEIEELCSAVYRKNVHDMESFQARIEVAAGVGYRCPLCKAKGIDAGALSGSALVNHVRNAHRTDTDLYVVCPICAADPAKAKSRDTLVPKLIQHLNDVHKSEASSTISRSPSEGGASIDSSASGDPTSPVARPGSPLSARAKELMTILHWDKDIKSFRDMARKALKEAYQNVNRAVDIGLRLSAAKAGEAKTEPLRPSRVAPRAGGHSWRPSIFSPVVATEPSPSTSDFSSYAKEIAKRAGLDVTNLRHLKAAKEAMETVGSGRMSDAVNIAKVLVETGGEDVEPFEPVGEAAPGFEDDSTVSTATPPYEVHNTDTESSGDDMYTTDGEGGDEPPGGDAGGADDGEDGGKDADGGDEGGWKPPADLGKELKEVLAITGLKASVKEEYEKAELALLNAHFSVETAVRKLLGF